MEKWKDIEFAKFAKLTKGISYTSADYCKEGEGAIFITLKCIAKAGGFSQRGIKYYKGFIPTKQLIKKGDLLFANTDITRDGDIVGCPVYLPDLGSDSLITMSMDLSRVDFINERIDPKFIYYQLMIDSTRKFMKENSSGSTVLHLNTSKVYSLKLSIPESKLEQTRIAEILSTADAAIAHTEALIAKYQRIKTGLMQDLLTRGIDEQGNIRSEDTHRFVKKQGMRVPEEWEVDVLDSLITAVDAQPNHRTPKAVEDGIPYLGINDIDDLGNIDLKKCRKVSPTILREHNQRYTLNKGDIIFGKIGTIGEPKRINALKNVAISANVILIQPKETPGFIFWLLNSAFIMNQVKNSIHSTSQPAFGMEKIRSLKILVPPKKEREEIEVSLNNFDFHLKYEQKSLAKLHALKTGLMQDLLSGRVRVKINENSHE